MAVTLDATVGGASSNSYTTRAESLTLLEPNVREYQNWITVAPLYQEAWLVFATTLMDHSYNYIGSGVVAETQALQWPREDVYDRNGTEIATTVIPTDIKLAISELAYWWSQNDPYAIADTTGFKKMQVDTLLVEIDKRDRIQSIPSSVQKIMKWWGSPASGSSYTSTYRSLERA